MSNTLTPCPFCGSQARVKSATYNDLGAYGTSEWEKKWFAVYCPSCKVSQLKRKYFDKEEAVLDWNRRV